MTLVNDLQTLITTANTTLGEVTQLVSNLSNQEDVSPKATPKLTGRSRQLPEEKSSLGYATEQRDENFSIPKGGKYLQLIMEAVSNCTEAVAKAQAIHEQAIHEVVHERSMATNAISSKLNGALESLHITLSAAVATIRAASSDYDRKRQGYSSTDHQYE